MRHEVPKSFGIDSRYCDCQQMVQMKDGSLLIPEQVVVVTEEARDVSRLVRDGISVGSSGEDQSGCSVDASKPEPMR